MSPTTSCPTRIDEASLRRAVADTYERLANDPSATFHFHRGAAYAIDRLRYDADALATVPAASRDAFAGVGNPHRIGTPRRGERVLDLGCGAGLDLLLSARAVGGRGRAIGVDMTEAMREKAWEAAREAGLADRVTLLDGIVESLPIEDESIDVVQSNGVLNLVPDKEAAFREIARVLRPGGRLHLADVTLRSAFGEDTREDIDLWAA